ncbi:MAG: anthranilate phosphoribosyltransferase [Rhodospirillales bacterium]|nr:anthranilate phosphoribosyltransferase [Rhodospirillales bacterium]
MSNTLKPVLARLAAGETLSEREAEEAFDLVMGGEATPAQIGALLMAMRLRGETVAELTGAVKALRSRMQAIAAPAGAIDVCGTGGDNAGTLNVSTAVAFVVAGAGVPVAKHGNRALSSRTGAADVLAALGIDVDVALERLPAILAEAGCVFLFAPRHHASMRHAAGPRAELGTRTIFNLLGPMANPARVCRQLTGVFSPDWLTPMAETLGALGSDFAWLVHGQGLDELTLAGDNHVVEWNQGRLRRFVLTPEEAGLARAPIAAIRGGEAAENAAALRALLEGATGAYRDTVLFNAAAALIVAGRAQDLADGMAMAREALDSGAARMALERLRALTRPPDTASHDAAPPG